MTVQEYLLTKLAEEAAEVTQRATKALTFGLHEAQPGQMDNEARLLDEIVDMCLILQILQRDHGMGCCDMSEANLVAKEAKVRQWMEYSRQCGTLGQS